MNVAALIFALIGAALSLFQGFIFVPFLGSISLDNIWALILSNLSETGNLISKTWNGLSNAGEIITFIIIFLLVLSFLFTPLRAVLGGFRAFLRREGKENGEQPWEILRDLSVICVIASGVLYLFANSIIKAITQNVGESEMVVGAVLPAHSMFLSYVPLIWAACFGIASACAYADMKEQNKLKQNSDQQTKQLKKIQELQEQINKIQSDMNKSSNGQNEPSGNQ